MLKCMSPEELSALYNNTLNHEDRILFFNSLAKVAKSGAAPLSNPAFEQIFVEGISDSNIFVTNAAVKALDAVLTTHADLKSTELFEHFHACFIYGNSIEINETSLRIFDRLLGDNKEQAKDVLSKTASHFEGRATKNPKPLIASLHIIDRITKNFPDFIETTFSDSKPNHNGYINENLVSVLMDRCVHESNPNVSEKIMETVKTLILEKKVPFNKTQQDIAYKAFSKMVEFATEWKVDGSKQMAAMQASAEILESRPELPRLKEIAQFWIKKNPKSLGAIEYRNIIDGPSLITNQVAPGRNDLNLLTRQFKSILIPKNQ